MAGQKVFKTVDMAIVVTWAGCENWHITWEGQTSRQPSFGDKNLSKFRAATHRLFADTITMCTCNAGGCVSQQQRFVKQRQFVTDESAKKYKIEINELARYVTGRAEL